MIDRYEMSASSTVPGQYYRDGYQITQQIKEKLCDELHYMEFVSLVDVYGDQSEGQLTMMYGDFKVYIVSNGSGGMTITIYDTNNQVLSGVTATTNHIVDYEHTLTYMNVIKSDKFLCIGFSDANNLSYKFQMYFCEFMGIQYATILPTTNTDVTLYQSDGTWKWNLTTILNIRVQDINKGLFRAFLPTDNLGYAEIINAFPDMYNINTGHTFTMWQPVTINTLDFVPLNQYTLIKIS